MAKAPAKATGAKAGSAAKAPRRGGKPAERPRSDKEKIIEERLSLPPDPDTIVTEQCGDRLEAEFKKRKISISRSECHLMAFGVVAEFIRGRAREWGFRRPISGVGKPRAEIVGFAEAALPAIADTGVELELPFDKPIGDWEPDQVATLLAIGFDAIEEQRVRVMEADGDEIPF